MELNGNAKKASLGTVVLAVLGILGVGTTEATGTTNLLGGLTEEDVIRICATHDQLRPVEALAKEAWELAGDNALNRLYDQLALAQYQLAEARKIGDQSAIQYWQREVNRLQSEIRRRGG